MQAQISNQTPDNEVTVFELTPLEEHQSAQPQITNQDLPIAMRKGT